MPGDHVAIGSGPWPQDPAARKLEVQQGNSVMPVMQHIHGYISLGYTVYKNFIQKHEASGARFVFSPALAVVAVKVWKRRIV